MEALIITTTMIMTMMVPSQLLAPDAGTRLPAALHAADSIDCFKTGLKTICSALHTLLLVDLWSQFIVVIIIINYYYYDNDYDDPNNDGGDYDGVDNDGDDNDDEDINDE